MQLIHGDCIKVMENLRGGIRCRNNRPAIFIGWHRVEERSGSDRRKVHIDKARQSAA